MSPRCLSATSTSLTKDGEKPIRLCNYVDVYKNERIRTRLPFMKATASLDEVTRFHLEVGDVLITKDSESWTDIGVPALVEETAGDLICGYHLAILRPFRGRTLGGYLLRAVQAPAAQYQFHVQANGVTRYGLSHDAIKAAWLPLPPREEQAAIELFLNNADRHIRRYIRTKQKLIKLLEEQRQAIIHRAVTRGVNPDVRLKPSGVEWLGEIPAHWTVSRVKSEFECLDRRRVPLNGPERGAMTRREYDYYGASGVIDRVESFLFDDDLLLIAEDGANLVLRHLPLAIVAHGRFWVNNHAHILRPKRGNLDYLAALMETLNYKPWISGAAQPKLTQDRLMSIAIAVPFRDEQDQIMASIKEETASLRLAIDHARREIAFVREFRTRLIADVVTGKADVREAAARLPAEIDEAEMVDDVDAIDDTEPETDADLDAETEEVGV